MPTRDMTGLWGRWRNASGRSWPIYKSRSMRRRVETWTSAEARASASSGSTSAASAVDGAHGVPITRRSSRSVAPDNERASAGHDGGGNGFTKPCGYLPFGCGKNVERTPGSTRPLATHLHEAIDRFVVTERIMVGESQSLGVRGDPGVDRPPGGG